jgi:hypothetical protein
VSACGEYRNNEIGKSEVFTFAFSSGEEGVKQRQQTAAEGTEYRSRCRL